MDLENIKQKSPRKLRALLLERHPQELELMFLDFEWNNIIGEDSIDGGLERWKTKEREQGLGVGNRSVENRRVQKMSKEGVLQILLGWCGGGVELSGRGSRDGVGLSRWIGGIIKRRSHRSRRRGESV